MMDSLRSAYPWTSAPLVANGPMRTVAFARMAVAVSQAGGLGFLGAGSDASQLDEWFQDAQKLLAAGPALATANETMPIGVGFLLWAGEPLLQQSIPLIEKYRPAAVWLYAHRTIDQAATWSSEIRRVTQDASQVWVQVGTVGETLEAVEHCQPDVLVIQGQDAGGHGLISGAGLIPLFPEADDAITALCQTRSLRKPALVAAGGIIEGRGAAAALALGAQGIVLGTRYLACPEAEIPSGYKSAVLAAADGGVSTARGTLYDQLRGTTDWPARYGGRGVLNASWFEAAEGLGFAENKAQYEEALKKGDGGWGEPAQARLTTYAGSGVGLVKEVKSAGEITREMREEAVKVLQRASAAVAAAAKA